MSLISIIVAIDENNIIGKNNQLPWHMSADLQYFKKTTLGKPIIMGRKTFASIGKALPGRRNIIISRNKNFTALNIETVSSLSEALTITQNTEEVMIIGGSQIFAEALPIADRLYITFIHHAFQGDRYFPHWQKNEWQETSRQDFNADEKNPYSYSFVVLNRIKNNTIKKK